MPLGMEVGDIVLDGDQAPRERGTAAPPLFGPCLLCQNGWMDQDTTWYRGRPRHRRHSVRWGPSSPHGKGQSSPPTFHPMSIVAKQSPISAAAELLLVMDTV